MKIESLNDMYIHELQDIYSAEDQILEALPKMADATDDPELKNAFMEHLEVTQKQKERLDRIFGELGEKPNSVKCEGVKGIIKEGESLIKNQKNIFKSDIDQDVLNAALISSAQRVEHYEMAVYGTLRNYAKRLGLNNQADLLQETLNEEGKTDHELTRLAENRINREAAA